MRKFAITCIALGLLSPAIATAADGGCIPTDSVVLVTPGGKAKTAPEAEPAAAAPATARPALPKTGPTAKVIAGAMLRGSPTLSTQDVQPLPRDSMANLKAPFKNNDGAWWYVTVNGVGAGWLRLADLTEFTAAPR